MLHPAFKTVAASQPSSQLGTTSLPISEIVPFKRTGKTGSSPVTDFVVPTVPNKTVPTEPIVDSTTPNTSPSATGAVVGPMDNQTQITTPQTAPITAPAAPAETAPAPVAPTPITDLNPALGGDFTGRTAELPADISGTFPNKFRVDQARRDAMSTQIEQKKLQLNRLVDAQPPMLTAASVNFLLAKLTSAEKNTSQLTCVVEIGAIDTIINLAQKLRTQGVADIDRKLEVCL